MQKWVSYSQRYIFNAIPDTNHDANLLTLTVTVRVTLTPVMLNYAGEYGEYCDACQAAVTVIRTSDAALKSCLT